MKAPGAARTNRNETSTLLEHGEQDAGAHMLEEFQRVQSLAVCDLNPDHVLNEFGIAHMMVRQALIQLDAAGTCDDPRQSRCGSERPHRRRCPSIVRNANGVLEGLALPSAVARWPSNGLRWSQL
jgi:hypothetical protein